MLSKDLSSVTSNTSLGAIQNKSILSSIRKSFKYLRAAINFHSPGKISSVSFHISSRPFTTLAQ